MFGQITALLTEIRDELRDANQMNRDWIAKLEADHLAQVQAASEAQPIDKQAIYNEMERERKAKARKNKNAKVEEATTNG